MAVEEPNVCMCVSLACHSRSLFIYVRILYALFTCNLHDNLIDLLCSSVSLDYALTTLLCTNLFVNKLNGKNRLLEHGKHQLRACKLLVRVWVCICCVLWVYAVCKRDMHTRLPEVIKIYSKQKCFFDLELWGFFFSLVWCIFSLPKVKLPKDAVVFSCLVHFIHLKIHRKTQ